MLWSLNCTKIDFQTIWTLPFIYMNNAAKNNYIKFHNFNQSLCCDLFHNLERKHSCNSQKPWKSLELSLLPN